MFFKKLSRISLLLILLHMSGCHFGCEDMEDCGGISIRINDRSIYYAIDSIVFVNNGDLIFPDDNNVTHFNGGVIIRLATDPNDVWVEYIFYYNDQVPSDTVKFRQDCRTSYSETCKAYDVHCDVLEFPINTFTSVDKEKFEFHCQTFTLIER